MNEKRFVKVLIGIQASENCSFDCRMLKYIHGSRSLGAFWHFSLDMGLPGSCMMVIDVEYSRNSFTNAKQSCFIAVRDQG